MGFVKGVFLGLELAALLLMVAMIWIFGQGWAYLGRQAYGPFGSHAS